MIAIIVLLAIGEVALAVAYWAGQVNDILAARIFSGLIILLFLAWSYRAYRRSRHIPAPRRGLKGPAHPAT